MTKKRILIVDHAPELLSGLGDELRHCGFTPVFVANGADALALSQSERPSLVVMEVEMPGFDGFEFLKAFHTADLTAAIPVIFISARGTEIDRVLGLELGAEDYVTKPFNVRELVLRIRKVINRTRDDTAESGVFQFDELTINTSQHMVMLGDRRLELTRMEFALLEALARRREVVHTRERLMHEVWAADATTDWRTVDTHVRHLRVKLGPAARFIETLRGIGYRFRDPDLPHQIAPPARKSALA